MRLKDFDYKVGDKVRGHVMYFGGNKSWFDGVVIVGMGGMKGVRTETNLNGRISYDTVYFTDSVEEIVLSK